MSQDHTSLADPDLALGKYLIRRECELPPSTLNLCSVEPSSIAVFPVPVPAMSSDSDLQSTVKLLQLDNYVSGMDVLVLVDGYSHGSQFLLSLASYMIIVSDACLHTIPFILKW